MTHNFWGLKAFFFSFQIVYRCFSQVFKNRDSFIDWKYRVSSESLTTKET